MHHQGDNQPTASPAPPVVNMGREPGEKQARFIPNGRSVSMGNALTWIADAWGLFKQRTGLWIGFALVYTVLLLLLGSSVIWLYSYGFSEYGKVGIHSLVKGFMSFVHILVTAGVVYSCDVLRRVGSFTFSDLFAAFNRKTGPLLIIGLFDLGFTTVLALIHRILPLTVTGSTPPDTILIGRIIITLVGVACGMALWFAPALMMLHDISPVKAIRMSFSACFKNILPGIIFSLMTTMLIGISAIPIFFDLQKAAPMFFILGLLVTAPILFLCNYTSYRDIFFGQEN